MDALMGRRLRDFLIRSGAFSGPLNCFWGQLSDDGQMKE